MSPVMFLSTGHFPPDIVRYQSPDFEVNSETGRGIRRYVLVCHPISICRTHSIGHRSDINLRYFISV